MSWPHSPWAGHAPPLGTGVLGDLRSIDEGGPLHDLPSDVASAGAAASVAQASANAGHFAGALMNLATPANTALICARLIVPEADHVGRKTHELRDYGDRSLCDGADHLDLVDFFDEIDDIVEPATPEMPPRIALERG